MKSENNGKIAIAIVAMFVVALSVVGFTYAYFTASVKGNSAEKSVEVTAGKLKVIYASSQSIKANNIVPGWINDGAHYYDTVYSRTDVGGGNIHISAITDDTKVNCNGAEKVANPTTNVTECSDSGKVVASIAERGHFTVEDKSDTKDVNSEYVIRLNIEENSIADTDNLYVVLSDTNGQIYQHNLGSKGTKQVISPVLNGDRTKALDYYVDVIYQEANVSQDASQGKNFKFNVEVVGVASSNGTKYFDEDGVEVVPVERNTQQVDLVKPVTP